MAARRTGLDLPLPLQFLAAWLAVWLGRVLQEQVDFLKIFLNVANGGGTIAYACGDTPCFAGGTWNESPLGSFKGTFAITK